MTYSFEKAERQYPMNANRRVPSEFRSPVVRFTRFGRRPPEMRWMMVDEKFNVIEGFDKSFQYLYPPIEMSVFRRLEMFPFNCPRISNGFRNIIFRAMK
ncbi:MAG: hypothetical protein R2688_01490 [Fimbriimonadaceae bacterium]